MQARVVANTVPICSQLFTIRWWADLCRVLVSLDVPVLVRVDEPPTVDSVEALDSRLQASLAQHLFEVVMQSERLPLLRGRFLRLSQPPSLPQVCKAQPYLATPRTAHREALIRLITSDHPLAVEVLRRSTPPVPRYRRVCRCCRNLRFLIEDEKIDVVRTTYVVL